ncbi:MAG: acetyl-CoA carboxylase biotin carboxyl carrier protein [Porticoccaceae bacterium]|jgi:acetyl-CoA carboxylase biotin carboxyl carrier protein
MTIKADEIAKIVELFYESKWKEMHIEVAGMQLFLSTDPNARLTNSAMVTTAAASSVMQPVDSSSASAPQAAAPAPVTAEKPSAPAEISANWEAITAPNLGTFYRSPKPGAAPYVEVGQTVSADTEICLIEVMKLFTSLKAGANGVIRQICVADGDMVEAGQPLFYIERA